MAVSLTVTGSRVVNGRTYIRWSDKTEQEFDSLAEARAYVRDVLDDVRVKDLLRAIVIAKAVRPGAAGNAVASLPGTVATADLTIANVLRVV